MLSKHINSFKLLVLVTAFAGANVSLAAKKSIKDVTSKKSAEKVSAQMPSALPGAVNVHSLGVGMGQTFLNGDFSENGSDKITFDLYYTYSASYSFDMVANFHYTNHKFRNKEVTLPGLAVAIKTKLYQYDAFAPYALGGLGFYRPKVVRVLDNSLIESQGKLAFGMNLGAGVDLKLNPRFTMGILAHYHNPFDIKQELGPEVEGSYFKLLLMGLYTF